MRLGMNVYPYCVCLLCYMCAECKTDYGCLEQNNYCWSLHYNSDILHLLTSFQGYRGGVAFVALWRHSQGSQASQLPRRLKICKLNLYGFCFPSLPSTKPPTFQDIFYLYFYIKACFLPLCVVYASLFPLLSLHFPQKQYKCC